MQLERLIAALGPSEVVRRAPVEICELAYDTRDVPSGALCFCVPGARVDGHDLAPAAVAAGAGALVVERVLDVDVPQLVVPSVRAAMPRAAVAFFDDPTRTLDVAAVTGASGPTATALRLRLILEAAGGRRAPLNRIERRIRDETRRQALKTLAEQ